MYPQLIRLSNNWGMPTSYTIQYLGSDQCTLSLCGIKMRTNGRRTGQKILCGLMFHQFCGSPLHIQWWPDTFNVVHTILTHGFLQTSDQCILPSSAPPPPSSVSFSSPLVLMWSSTVDGLTGRKNSTIQFRKLAAMPNKGQTLFSTSEQNSSPHKHDAVCSISQKPPQSCFLKQSQCWSDW